jgi:hypothetical protein
MDNIVKKIVSETIRFEKNKFNKMKKGIIDDDSIYRMIVSKTINKLDSSLLINQCENGAIGLDPAKA